jgi:hypothetical protein
MNADPNTWWAAVVGSHNADIASSITTGYDHCTSFKALQNGQPVYPAPLVIPAGKTLAQVKYNVRDWIARFHNQDFAYIENYTPLATPNVYTDYEPLAYVNDHDYVLLMKQLLGNFETAASPDSTDIIRAVDVTTPNTLDWQWKLKISSIKVSNCRCCCWMMNVASCF